MDPSEEQGPMLATVVVRVTDDRNPPRVPPINF